MSTLASSTADSLAAAIQAGDRVQLARGITLIESEAARHADTAASLVQRLLPFGGKARRIGISGIPGVGKSSLIEALGVWLCEQGLTLAVLAVDPSSSLSGGSILGDKTRMEHLSRHPNAFIRPSPSGKTLGGVARKTRETILLCEAAGFDLILVETVGVGQSEITVRSLVDFFILLALTGAGDELQGIKKGIMELADMILVTKADGDNAQRALGTMAELKQVLHYITPATPGWESVVQCCSALTGEGIPEIWSVAQRFFEEGQKADWIERRRRLQSAAWFRSLLEESVLRQFFEQPQVKDRLPVLEEQVISGLLSATEATRLIIESASLPKSDSPAR